MKNLILLTILCLLQFGLKAQTYPFQDNKLDDEKRLDNLISQLTLDEKINCLSTRLSIPRLGIKGTRTVEGLHGLALSGPANWAVKGKGAAQTSTFPQSIGLAQTWDPELLTQLASLEAEECRFLAHTDSRLLCCWFLFRPCSWFFCRLFHRHFPLLRGLAIGRLQIASRTVSVRQMDRFAARRLQCGVGSNGQSLRQATFRGRVTR